MSFHLSSRRVERAFEKGIMQWRLLQHDERSKVPFMARPGHAAELMLRVVAECVTITVCNALWEEWLEAPKT